MGDMGEVFNDMREAGKRKRQVNREASPELLDKAGIAYAPKKPRPAPDR